MTDGNVDSEMQFENADNQNEGDANELAAKCASKKKRSEFTYKNYVVENRGRIIYAVEFCNCLKDGEPIIFATCGSNAVTIYECKNSGEMQLLQCYEDPNKNESFYTLTWSFHPSTLTPVLAVAGLHAIIRIINPTTMTSNKHLIGHGFAVNDLKFHPENPHLLLSASKDFSARLWNIETAVCIAVFKGLNGHKCEVLSADFDATGGRIVTSGMDNSVRIWQLNKPEIQDAIRASYNGYRGFRTIMEHFPEYAVSDLHNKYVDCVKWMGNLILSKSNENSIVCWKPGCLQENTIADDSTIGSVIHKFDYVGHQYFSIRFAMNVNKTYLAVGNDRGTTFVWKIDPTAKPMHLRHVLCNETIRDVAFSRDSNILIAVCDTGTVWKWDRVPTTC
ncbi:polycomb protein EED-like [Bradysia coprophila]|uniref:polycomb protein EED-like n=1 Tax=Bradysia coprophila TaxID=38358 RepID=UPI00187D892A|nr:polycomb protein EED-like [Bradysia coprophila]